MAAKYLIVCALFSPWHAVAGKFSFVKVLTMFAELGTPYTQDFKRNLRG